MRDYKFTQKNLETIASLNARIRKEELRTREQLFVLQAQLGDLVNRSQIDDFIIDFEFLVFTNNEVINRKHNVEEGDPIYKSYVLTEGHFEWDAMFFENWNEYQFDKSHPLASLNFCYTMHDIVFDSSHLDWEDILAISDIWLKIKVDYQFLLNKDLVAEIKRGQDRYRGE